jgi:hypothetical protein
MPATSSRAFALALALVACGKRGDRETPAPAPAAATGSLSILVDGERALTLAPADLEGRPALAELLGPGAPAESWRRIEADAPGGRTLSATRPNETYRGQEAILYLDGGRPALGMFRRVADLPPALQGMAGTPTIALAGITEIRVRTREAERPAARAVTLELVAGGKPCRLDTPALAVVPAAAADGRGGDRDRPTWDVRELARRCFGKPPTRVVAPPVDAATRARADRMVVAKVNRRGELHVRLLELRPGGRPRVLADATPARIEIDL